MNKISYHKDHSLINRVIDKLINYSILPPTLSYGAFRKQSMEEHCKGITVPTISRREQIDRALGQTDTQRTKNQKMVVEDFQIVVRLEGFLLFM